jgi:palmitoyl transferase
MKRLRAAVVSLLMAVSGTAAADGMSGDLRDHFSNSWDYSKRAFTSGDWSLYLSGYTWHAPWAYSSQRRSEQNEAAYGGGIGRYLVDPQGNYHGLYMMEFQDSHFKPSYAAGMNWMTYRPLVGRLEGGLGYTLFFFSRADIGSYFPIPGALPMASLRYGRAELMGTAVPGFSGGNGNIAFFFGRYNF